MICEVWELLEFRQNYADRRSVSTRKVLFFIPERMMTLANYMYNFIIAGGPKDVVDRYEKEALDGDFNIDFSYSYTYAKLQHGVKLSATRYPEAAAIANEDPDVMKVIDKELGEILYGQMRRCGDWVPSEVSDKYISFGCFDGQTLGSLVEPDGQRYILSSFITKWCEKPALVQKLSWRYPELEFTYYFIEERILACNGIMKFKNGKCHYSRKPTPYSQAAHAIARNFCSEKEIQTQYLYDGKQWRMRH